MNEITATGEPATEVERLIAELSESGLLVFVFGVGWWTAHLVGATRPVFRAGGRAVVARRTRRRCGELDDVRAGR